MAGNKASEANLKYAETLMTPDQIAEAKRRAAEWMEAFRNR
jgi:hypothetical protein